MKSRYRWSLVLVVLILPIMGATKFSINSVDEVEEISLQYADYTFVGEQIGDWAGYFASPAGDVNGDGYMDILIGAPKAGTRIPGFVSGEGKAYLILGSPNPDWSPAPPTSTLPLPVDGLFTVYFPSVYTPPHINLAWADAAFKGCRQGSMSARQLYTAGDVNGDGYDDFLISGWQCEGYLKGEAYLFLGRPDVEYWGSDYPLEQADAIFVGENDKDTASYYSSEAGDINADGYDDFLITATHYDITGTEVITDVGKAYLILGRREADWGRNFDLSQADASFLGSTFDYRLGRSTAAVGDVNSDGYADFMIGSIESDDGGVDAGEAFLFLGRPRDAEGWWGKDFPVNQADASFIGENDGDEVGRRVAGAGDVNGDGYDDMLIGAAAYRNYTGKAYLILGKPEADWGTDYSLADADASFVGEKRKDEAGRRVSGAGDVNHDGYSDFLIGAPHSQRGGFFAGTAYLVYGRAAADWGRDMPVANLDVAYIGMPDVRAAGYDVADIGDFNGDGIDDFVIAAYGSQIKPYISPGEVYLILGR